jgi:glycosyltransferase involved in cell wall biosynthesis
VSRRDGNAACLIGLLHAGDPLGFVPSGIDAFVRGLLRWAPPELEYVWFGASSDLAARPLGHPLRLQGLHREGQFVPLVPVEASGRRTAIPLTIRYLLALRRHRRDTSMEACDILDFHRPEPMLLFARDSRPKNLTLHQDMAVIRQKHSDILWRHAPGVYEMLEKRLIRQADHVYCVRETAVKRYQATWPEQASKFSFISTWVDTEVFKPYATEAERTAGRAKLRSEMELPSDALLLTFVGRLDRQKNPLLLLEAFAEIRSRLPCAHLTFVGDGLLRSSMERWIQERSLANAVTLTGALPPKRIAEIHRAADLFVLSSAYEGMPIALLEALACGLPATCTDVGEICRVLHDGENGTLCMTQSASDMAKAAIEAVAQLESMRGDPCTRAVRRYGPESVLAVIYEHHRRQAHA